MMSSEEQTTVSEHIFTSSEEDEVAINETSKLFILGFMPKARHNSSLKAISAELLSNFFIASNSTNSSDSTTINRQFLEKSDILLFFVNEQTLRDTTCLLTLQYAYLSQIPIVLLRPPMVQLIISNRDLTRDKEKITKIANSAIMRSSSSWNVFNESTIDYNLLQDILHTAFKLSLLYDKQDHSRCMSRIRRSLQNILIATTSPNNSSESSSSQPHFYLSPSNHSISSVFSRHVNVDDSSTTKRRGEAKERLSGDEDKIPGKSRSSSRTRAHPMKLDLSSSTGNLTKVMRTPHPVKFTYGTSNGEGKNVLKSPPPPERIPSSVAVSDCGNDDLDDDFLIPADKFPLPPLTPMTPHSRRPPLGSATSQSSSLDRRMSLSCIEDLANYQRTQYLVFPLRDSGKKPYLLKFPDDMHEEEEKHGGSVWGSDTSLEEEIKLAGTINAGIIIDQMDDSPIHSPAPYLGDLQ